MILEEKLQWKAVFKQAMALVLSLGVVSCGFLEDTVNKVDSKEPINVTLATSCTDKNVAASESIILNPQSSELMKVLNYFIQLKKDINSGKLATPTRLDEVPDPMIRDMIRAKARQAWQQSLAIAAKDHYIKDKMEVQYYENLLFKMFFNSSQGKELRNCYFISFIYEYSPFEIGTDGEKKYKTELLVHAVDDLSEEELSCDISEGEIESFQSMSLCLDETNPRPSGGSSGGGSFDDD